jgi:predicted nucleotidyltransferase
MNDAIWDDFVDTIDELSKYQKKVRKGHKKKKAMYVSGGKQKNTPPFTKRANTSRSKSAPAGYGALEEVAPEDVTVAGFDTQDELSPSLWENKKLLPDIREKLLQIAQDFIDSLEMGISIIDVRLTGSLANYNWSKFSDVDLHIVVDFAAIDDNTEIVKGFFDAKRVNWNYSHEIMIDQYEVEIYVEDDDEDHISTGIYSVTNDKWTIEPGPNEQVFEIDEGNVKKKAASIMTQIEFAEGEMDDDPKKAYEMSDRIKEKIRNMRASGLKTSQGQYSIENVAFKVLRRSDYLQRLSDLKTKSYDKMMSMEQ